MGKRKSSGTKANKTAAAGYSPYHGRQNAPTTLREESTGKKKQKPVNGKSMLKLDHIKNLALWANGEASIPSLGAFFGNRLSQTVEALSVPPDPNLFSCQRCQSILEPGFNCTVRIEKQQQQHKHKKFNRAVYHCHFCSHQNLKRGTPKNYMKEIYGEKPKSRPKAAVVEDVVKNVEKTPETESSVDKDSVSCPETVIDEPSTPMMNTRPAATLLELRSKKRNRCKTQKTVESVGAKGEAEKSGDTNTTTISSKKRKRKSWTSLKEIAERSSQHNAENFVNLKIPFLI